MLPIIVEAAIRSMVLVAAVWVGLTLLRITNPHVLMSVWQLVLGTSLVMPFVVGWATFPLPQTPMAFHGLHQIHQMLSSDPPVLLSPSAGPVLPEIGHSIIDWRAACASIYLVVAAFLLLRLLAGSALTWKLARSALPVREDWTADLDVRASARITVPVTFGSMILLPANYVGWDATKRRAVMAHECAHVSRRDFYILLLASINRAIFWFSPLAWWLNSRIAYLAEARSDAAAIADIDDRVRYAEILLAFGATPSRATISLAMAGTTTVARRVEHILAETIVPKTMTWKTWLAVLACVLPLAALTVGAVAQAPAQTQGSPAQTPANNGSTATHPDSSTKPLPTPDAETLRQRQEEQKKPRHEIQIVPAILDSYVGYYKFGAYRVMTVTRQDDHLFVQFTGQDVTQVYPESPQKFFYKNAPTQISFVTDAQGHATGLVLHQGGLERPAPRIDQAEAQKLQVSFAKRLKGEAPMPGSEAALRGQIDAFEKGQPDFDAMTEGLAAVTRPQVPKIQREFALLGPLQSISFMGVGISGWDIYEAKFTNGISICRILLTPDAKIGGLRFEWGP